jgi:hypothetical protein
MLAGLVAFGSVLPSARAASGRHCAIQLTPVSGHGSVIEAKATLIGCYPSFAQALSAGSRGTINVDASITPDQLENADLPTASPSSSVLIGTEFNLTGFGGTSNDYFAATACAGTDVWEVNYVGDTWNDLFSSGKGFGGCDHNKKFQDADYGGSVLTCTPQCNDYGSLSNQVSSLRWKP